MKKLLLLSALLIFACSTDSEGNPCIYEPTLTTEAVTYITETSATLNGVISIVSENCDVAPGEMQGFVYSTYPSPTNDDNVQTVYGTNISFIIDGLEPNTTYYVRSFLTNTIGEFYGNEVDFTTNEEMQEGCDEMPYPSIFYGTQEWTIENACHIFYRDGTPIPQVTDNDEWQEQHTGAWRYYDDDPSKGKLYNWYAVAGIHDASSLTNTTLRKEFAPESWHVASDDEWTTLENYLIANGYNYDGTTTENKIAKAMASTAGWNSSTQTGSVGNGQSNNNGSGFNAFPEGFCNDYGDGQYESEFAVFWTSSQLGTTAANLPFVGWYRLLSYDSSQPDRNYSGGRQGFSVRLVRD